jgi:small neutral amino acid transporter SnatA (MarC family)
MTAYWELAVVLAAAVNPAAIAAAASELPGSRASRGQAVAIAWAIGAGMTAAAAYGAERLLAGLELSHETFRIAAGAVLAVTGTRETWRGSPRSPPFPTGLGNRGCTRSGCRCSPRRLA